MDKELDRLSYALGMSMGHNFKSSGIEKVDSADFAAGVAAVYEGAEPRISYDEAKNIIREYFTALEARQQEAAKEMAAVNAAAGEAFLAENGKRPEVNTTASGLQYEVVKEGDGPMPAAADRVVVHYTGRLIDGTVFDSSEDARLSPAGVVPGFGEGLEMLGKGGKATLYIPGKLAYGVDGAPRAGIGPNAMLIFDIEVLDVNPGRK